MSLPEDFQTAPLAEVDPEIAQVLDRELARQQGTLEMIASENFVPQGVLEASGSVLTNKYAEGYPGKRYYGGCEEVDVAERLAIDRAKELFGAEHANLQPHAGAQANNAAYMAMLEPGDTIMGMALDHGGHLSHGMKLNVSGKLYGVVPYHVRRDDLLVDMDEVAELAGEHKPKLIIAGWSAYPRRLDFAAFREIADAVGARLMVDMAHFAGLVAAGEHPNPVEHADVVTTTIHKTLCGPRSGMIMCREELAKDINRSVFPGQQGGPLMHAIAAKAVALKIAASEQFRARQRQTIANARALGEGLVEAGVDVLTGGTDVHLVLTDLTPTGVFGKEAERRLEQVGITVNRNAIPFDERPPMDPSGLRIGTPALTTRGLLEDDMREIAAVIGATLGDDYESQKDSLLERSRALMERYPLYPQLSPAVV
jgi:glycine hydroxymethyltransferase